MLKLSSDELWPESRKAPSSAVKCGLVSWVLWGTGAVCSVQVRLQDVWRVESCEVDPGFWSSSALAGCNSRSVVFGRAVLLLFSLLLSSSLSWLSWMGQVKAKADS